MMALFVSLPFCATAKTTKNTVKSKVITPKTRPILAVYSAYRGPTIADFYSSLSAKAQQCIIKKYTVKQVRAWEADPNATLLLGQVAYVERCDK